MKKATESKGPEHWTINRASAEFGVDRGTLQRAVKKNSIEPAFKDGTYSTQQICRAVFSDKEAEQTRLTANNADLAELEKLEKIRALIPADMVAKVWNNTLADLRNKISYSQIPQQMKVDLVKDLQAVSVDDYFSEKKSDEADDDTN